MDQRIQCKQYPSWLLSGAFTIALICLIWLTQFSNPICLRTFVKLRFKFPHVSFYGPTNSKLSCILVMDWCQPIASTNVDLVHWFMQLFTGFNYINANLFCQKILSPISSELNSLIHSGTSLVSLALFSFWIFDALRAKVQCQQWHFK